MCPTDHNEILHMSRQCYCRGMCKISLWSDEYAMNKSITKVHLISNAIETSLARRPPDDWDVIQKDVSKINQYLATTKHNKK